MLSVLIVNILVLEIGYAQGGSELSSFHFLNITELIVTSFVCFIHYDVTNICHNQSYIHHSTSI